MPLFKLKKTLLLSTAITTAAMLSGCGGGGGGSSSAGPAKSPCDSNYVGSSVAILDSFENGTLKGHIEAGTFKNGGVTLTTRDGFSGEATIGSDCKSFTITSVPAADTLNTRNINDVRDADADYSIEVVNNAGADYVSTAFFLGRGAELQNVSTLQINNSAFAGPSETANDGVINWFSTLVSGYDIKAKLEDTKGGTVKPAIYPEAPITGNITDIEKAYSLLSPDLDPTVSKVNVFLGSILDANYKNYDFYIYVTDVTLGGEDDSAGFVSNGANLDMAILNNGVKSNGGVNPGFDISLTATFNGDGSAVENTIVTAKAVAVNRDDRAVQGFVDIEFTIPDASMSFTVNALSGVPGSELLAFVMAREGQAFKVNESGGSLGGVVESINVIGCNICTSAATPENPITALNDSSLFANFADLQALIPAAADEAVGSELEELFNSIQFPAGTTLVDLASPSNGKQVALTSIRGLVTEAQESAVTKGGFISAGGSAVFEGTPLNTALGSYFEKGGSTAAKTANFDTSSGVVLAVSEASINQTLLATFESGELDSVVVAPFKFSQLNIAQLSGLDDVDVHVVASLASVPHMDIGKEGNATNQIEAVMKNMKLKISLDGTDTASGVNWDMAHVMDIYLSPNGTLTYALIEGLPQGMIASDDIDLNISSITVHDDNVKLGLSVAGITDAMLKTVLDSSLKAEIATVIQSLGADIISAKKVKVVDMAPSTGPTAEILAANLPQTLGVKLTAISSDADGKYLLLKGDVRVEETVTPAEGMLNAIYSYILCDSNAPIVDQNDYCKQPVEASEEMQ